MKNTKANTKCVKPFAEAIQRFSGPKLAWSLAAKACLKEASVGIEEGQNNTFLVDLKTKRRIAQFHPDKPPGWMDERTRAIAMRRSLATKRKGKA